MSELPAHLADGWHLLCQARDYIRAGGNKGLEEEHLLPPPYFCRTVKPIQIMGGGQIMPVAIQLAHQIFRPSVGSAILYVGSVH